MSGKDSIRLTQQFDFEVSIAELNGGFIFQPLVEATDRWVQWSPASYRMSGSNFDALYQLKTGKWVLLQCGSALPERFIDENQVIPTEGEVRGFFVDGDFAAKFLKDGRFKLPEELVQLLTQTTSASAPLEPPQIRELEFWRENAPTQTGKLHAHEIRVTSLLVEIRDVAIKAVHEIRTWPALETRSRGHKQTAVLLLKLTERYRVDALQWWGSKKSVPPERVGILQLRWPDGVEELKRQLIPELEQLVVPAASILFCRMPMSHSSLYPTDIEVEMAETNLIQNCEAIDRLAASLITAIDDLTSGRVFERLISQTNGKRNVPKEWEMRAYMASTFRGLKYSEIKTDQRLSQDTTNIGRAIKRVSSWLASGNELPPGNRKDDIPAPKTSNMDPAKIDMGANREGRSLSQRRRKADQ